MPGDVLSPRRVITAAVITAGTLMPGCAATWLWARPWTPAVAVAELAALGVVTVGAVAENHTAPGRPSPRPARNTPQVHRTARAMEKAP